MRFAITASVQGSGGKMKMMLCSFVLVMASATAVAAETSAGSGVVIGTQGEILTNSHVVEDCQKNGAISL
jgi:S1-C subfamily serine protease